MQITLIFDVAVLFAGDELIYVCLHCSYQLKQHSKLVIHVEKYHKNQGKSEIEKLLEDPSSNVSDVRQYWSISTSLRCIENPLCELKVFLFQIIERLSGAKLVCGKRDCPQRFETKDQLDNHYLHDHHMVRSLKIYGEKEQDLVLYCSKWVVWLKKPIFFLMNIWHILIWRVQSCFIIKNIILKSYLFEFAKIVQDGGFVYLCPQSGCTFTSKENKLMVRHLAVKHDIRNRETSGRRRIKPESDKDWENVDPESEQLPNFSSQKPGIFVQWT